MTSRQLLKLSQWSMGALIVLGSMILLWGMLAHTSAIHFQDIAPWDSTPTPVAARFDKASHPITADNVGQIARSNQWNLDSPVFDPNGIYLAAGARLQQHLRISLWDTTTEAAGVPLSLSDEAESLYSTINSMTFSPNGAYLASGGQGTGVAIWDVPGRRLSNILRIDEENGSPAIETLAFSPDGRFLAGGYGSLRGEVRLWDTSTGALQSTFGAGDFFSGYAGAVLTLDFHPSRMILAWGTYGDNDSSGRTIACVWNLEHNTAIYILEHELPVETVRFSPDGRLLATGSGSIIHLWDMDTGTERRALRGHAGTVNSLVYNPDGTLLISGSDDGTIRFWNTHSDRELLVLSEHDAPVIYLALDSSGSQLVSADSEGNVFMWAIR